MQAHLERILNNLYRYFQRLDRVGIVWWIGVAYTLFLLSTTFSYTVLQYDFFSKKATEQQTMILKNPTSRGSIYSSEDSLHGVLSVSTNLGNLAIDPSQSGSRDKLLTFLVDLVFDEYCQNTANCLSAMSSYLREDITSTDITVTDLKAKLRNYLATRMDAPVESSLVVENLDDEKIRVISDWQESSLFFVSNNLYVNPTKVSLGDTLAARIAEVTGLKKDDILPRFEIRKKRHLEIIRKMSISTRDMVTKRIETEKNAVRSKQILESEAVYPYLKIEDNLVRFYPEKGVAGQITGFVDGE